ncbi:hypothetical protein EYF80_038402 [Liparis tanakae]|uniref:Uncharacterized protein n=1 Tax=Liparis tanakae TaxID=230148 RepID=A0A4Z2GDK7_9TELE|nr:hypothetical protein EYF80_038402 [Liparis tanakae]
MVLHVTDAHIDMHKNAVVRDFKKQRPGGHERDLSLTSLCASHLPLTWSLGFHGGVEVTGGDREEGG